MHHDRPVILRLENWTHHVPAHVSVNHNVVLVVWLSVLILVMSLLLLLIILIGMLIVVLIMIVVVLKSGMLLACLVVWITYH